ncbi:type II secretion system protein [Desulfuromonas versatilis]|uniref:Type II secretion system protein n=1 Tax=Desulfuromonas versatilis TaxID=2802975 RepID=A0ABM8HUV6_9BACT|nr:type II secretion system protein [Desulfuromonas versatilis]
MVMLGGCAANHAFINGEQLLQEGKYDEAVAQLMLAVSQNPDNNEYRSRLRMARSQAATEYLKKGRKYLDQDDYRSAAAAFSQAFALDNTLETAGQQLKLAEEQLRAEGLVDEAEEFIKSRRFSQAKNNLDQALILAPGNARARELLARASEGPRTVIDGQELDVASDKKITLKFKDAQLKDIFGILTKLSGINFIFDEDIRTQTVSVFLEEASFAQALQLLLKMNDLGKKVLNPKTIIVYPRTKEKDKQFEDQLIQTFYLSNIDAKKAVNLLRTMLQLRKIYVHEELNALVIRDNPDVIRLAQQILEASDRADAEVVFDLEVVEVSHTDTLTLGPKLSNYNVSVGVSKGNPATIVANSLSSGTSTENLVHSVRNLDTFYTLPTATFDFAKSLTDSEVLASPKIRVKNKDKAKVHIGTREPVITVTTSGETTSDNIQYVDVGIKLDVEPTIQLDDTVATKLSLEVSSVSDRQTTTNGSVALTITTTNAQTGLTLKDGEQTIIGGLIRDDKSKGRTTIPFLGELPVIGNLFTGHNNTKQKREILLSITPHIVRSLDLPRVDVASIWSGGEDDLKAGPNFGAFATTFEPVTDQGPIPLAPSSQQPSELPDPEMTPALELQPAPGARVLPGGVPPVPSAGELQPGSLLPAGPIEPLQSPAPPAAGPTAAVVEQPTPVAPAPLPAAPPQAAAVPAPAVPQVVVPAIEVPAAGGKARVYMSGPQQVPVGQEFTLAIEVAEVEGLYSAPLFVNYDAAKAEFIRAEEGSFLGQGGRPTIFTSSANPERGQLIIGYKQGLGGQGASGGGTLARLVFRAKGAGTALLNLDRINFRSPAGQRLSVDRSGLAVEIR